MKRAEQMSTRDADFRHNYVATGVDPGIISNRIGHTFNLHGPRQDFPTLRNVTAILIKR